MKDASSVKSYPPILGVRRRLFWLDHREPEGSPDADSVLATSHHNEYEVKITAALVAHIVRQGVYGSEDIAVLTPYLGQLRKLRAELSNTFMVTVGDRDLSDLENEGIEEPEDKQIVVRTNLLQALRLATIDNFQGEEAKVVIISLVRSNEQKKCGFLRTKNRINVALSRAQHGMYIISNAETSGHVEMWAQVLQLLESQDNIGRSLDLCCPRHPDTPIEVKTPDDFERLAPEGGCHLKCDRRLPCGHACVSQCHADHLHQAVRCLAECSKPVNGCSVHACPNVCGDPCPQQCEVPIIDVELPCGHIEDLPCYTAKDSKTARCGHIVPLTIRECGHEVMVKCHERNGEAAIICTAKCGATLPCGHNCSRRCTSCRTTNPEGAHNVDHGTCQALCGRSYTTCSHSCTSKCHGGSACGLCQAECDVRCAHSACKKTCFEPCTPCAEEKCTSACPHHQCEMPCAVPCNWIPCSKRCTEVLECGHQCPSVCGETCPPASLCQTCCTIEKKELSVDFIMGLTY